MTQKHPSEKNVQQALKSNETASDVETESQKENALLKELIRKEALIAQAESEQKKDRKEIKNITSSNTWKLFTPLRKLKEKFFATEKTQGYVRRLETELEQIQQQLLQTQQQLQALSLDDRKLKSHTVVENMRELKNSGELIDFVEKVVEDKQQHLANYQEALLYAARLFMHDDDIYRNFVYAKVLQGLSLEEIPEFIIRAGLVEDNALPLKQSASFRASLNMRIRQSQLIGALPEWLLDDKKDAYKFIDAFEIRRPWVSNQTYQMENLPAKEGIVIKPTDGAGSRGVYLVYQLNDIIDVKRGVRISNWDELIAHMKKDILTGWVHRNEWMTEELILADQNNKEPARDIKFYCFYGRVGLILEITRFPEQKHCWWDAFGNRIRTGKYEESSFLGEGASQEEIEMARTLSLQIPAPFIRIDFLRSSDELVFGEFTPKPGNYDDFNEEIDKQLGNYYLEAEGKLVSDLFNGKAFNTFKQLTAKIHETNNM
ncbi:ATP-grasp fold amidoligase family protein [Virgibacillus sp. Bac330]|uniref:ATP-grasp fold amidoligase family protein n=1 Tax=Virgibacillus sp. Bac330 TaxID=2419841 RepID=UPI000EF559DC|nr:ATP-grasp fold amidoligase family protein [Virgibacillus sp. Bac330]